MNISKRSFFTRLAGLTAALGLGTIAPVLAVCGPTVVSVENGEEYGEMYEVLPGGVCVRSYYRVVTRIEHMSDGTVRRGRAEDFQSKLFLPDGTEVSSARMGKPFCVV